MKRSRDEAEECDNTDCNQQKKSNENKFVKDAPSTKFVQQVDIEKCFKKMIDAARNAGAFWSEKLCRGIEKSSGLPGIVACADIPENEVICCIPARLHFSLPCFRSAMSDIFAAFDVLPMPDSERRIEAAHVACITRLLADALNKVDHGTTGDGQTRIALWNLCAKALSGIDFSEHPYRRALDDPDTLRDEFSPSGEFEHVHSLASYILSVYKCIDNHTPQELVGSSGLEDLSLFFHAWLCLLTREFGGPHGSTLVPLVDYFNHSSDAGAEQLWDDETEAVVIQTSRAHKVGEPVCIEYGKLSNPLLFRTYGFTIATAEEPACTCTFLESELQSLCKSEVCFGNPDFALHLATLPNLHLHSGEVTETLTLIIKACAKYAVSTNAFLRGVCSNRVGKYKRTERFQQSYRALWSRENESTTDENTTTEDRIQDDMLRVQLSELFCLEAHLEAMECVAGKLEEKQCQPRAAGLREDLRVLQKAGLWT